MNNTFKKVFGVSAALLFTIIGFQNCSKNGMKSSSGDSSLASSSAALIPSVSSVVVNGDNVFRITGSNLSGASVVAKDSSGNVYPLVIQSNTDSSLNAAVAKPSTGLVAGLFSLIVTNAYGQTAAPSFAFDLASLPAVGGVMYIGTKAGTVNNGGGITIFSDGSLTLGITRITGMAQMSSLTEVARLEMKGAMRAASAAVVNVCNAVEEGVQRYNYTTHSMEFCNGTAWLSVVTK